MTDTNLASTGSSAVFLVINLAVTGKLLMAIACTSLPLSAGCMDVADRGRRVIQSAHWLADPCTYSIL